jgi:hypothetical protein
MRPSSVRLQNDPDQLLIGNNGLSRTEAEVQMGMWALWSAPMILSVEVRNGSLAPEMKQILLNKVRKGQQQLFCIPNRPLRRRRRPCDSRKEVREFTHHGFD